MNYNKHMRLLSGRMMLAAFVMFLSLHARAAKGYAELSADGKTLTFKYGTPAGKLNTNYYNTDNTGTANPGWYSKRSSITTVVFAPSFSSARPTSCYGWFRDFTNLKTIDVDNLNTSSVTNMTYMFSGCSDLISIKCSKDWNNNTVTRSTSMFSGCNNLRGSIFYDDTKNDVSYANPATGYFSLELPAQGYAVFDSSTGTLTFKYGTPTGTLNTDYYNTDNTGTVYPGWYNKRSSITTVVFAPSFSSARPTSCYGWFRDFTNLKTIDLDNLNTSSVTNMSSMFSNCSSLQTIDVDNLNTSSVTNMSYMFSGCSSLISIKCSKDWNSNTVTSSTSMFFGCGKLRGAIAYRGTKEDVNYANPATGYFSLELVGQGYAVFDSSTGTLTFKCGFPTGILNTDYYDADNTGYSPGWSGKCASVTTVVFDPSFSSARPTSCYGWFRDFTKLQTIDVNNLNTSSVTTMSWMFNGCSSLISIKCSKDWKNNTVTSSEYMFRGCNKLRGAIVYDAFDSKDDVNYANPTTGYFSLEYVGQGYAVFDKSTGTLTFKCGIPAGTLNTDYYDADKTSRFMDHLPPEWKDIRSSIKKVVFDPSFSNARPANCSKWFQGCTNLTEIIGIENFNTSKVTDMYCMFGSCSALTSLDVTHFDTSSVACMFQMFINCSGLTSLDASGFDTSNVTDMTGMFLLCSSLTSLDVSGFNTSKVTNMWDVFAFCSSLTSLDVSGFDTSKVTSMDSMFSFCSSLASLDVSGFNTSNVTSMNFMFADCSSLTSLDVSGFDTSKVTNIGCMFQNCSNLTSLDVRGFDTSKVVSMSLMFNGCSSLTSLTFGKKFSTDNVNSCERMFRECRKLRYIDFYASDDTDAITSTNYTSMFGGTPATAVIYLPHGSKEVTNKQNLVYSYGGNQNDLRCPKYYSEDKVDIEFPRDFKTNEAVYKRTIGKSYGSVVLPYAFTTNSNIQAYTLNAEYTGMMYFKDAKTVAAHTPFAFKKLASGTEADFTMTGNNFGITVKATRSTNAAEDTWTGTKGSPYTANTNLGGWTAKGYYVEDTVNDYSDAYYIANEKFYKADGALTMYPHRVTFHGAWTKGTGNAKFFDIETGDEELITAIEAAETEQTLCEATGIYDASGRQQTAVRKGLNIVRMSDGSVKKVIVK